MNMYKQFARECINRMCAINMSSSAEKSALTRIEQCKNPEEIKFFKALADDASTIFSDSYREVLKALATSNDLPSYADSELFNRSDSN